MRSLPSIIKASEYDRIRSIVSLEELPRASRSSAVPAAPSSEEKQITTEDRQSGLRESAAQHQAIVKEAFQKAKNIVDAAQNYSLNQLRESTMRINEECAQMKIRSYEDGYGIGLEQGKREGHELGYSEGHRAGIEKAREEVEARNREKSEAAEEEIGRMLETIETEKEEILTKFKADLEGLSLAIARKIVKKELSTDETALQSIIKGVLESYRNQAWVKISVSPSDAGRLAKADRGLAEALQEVSDNIKVVPSPDLKEGDCLIDLPDRLIDAGANTQLDELQTALNF